MFVGGDGDTLIQEEIKVAIFLIINSREVRHHTVELQHHRHRHHLRHHQSFINLLGEFCFSLSLHLYMVIIFTNRKMVHA